MRRDTVTQVILQYADGLENFATRLEAERFIEAHFPDLPEAAWLEDMAGAIKWRYAIVSDASGTVSLTDAD